MKFKLTRVMLPLACSNVHRARDIQARAITMQTGIAELNEIEISQVDGAKGIGPVSSDAVFGAGVGIAMGGWAFGPIAGAAGSLAGSFLIGYSIRAN
jgi:hypothetical protein